MNIDEFGTLKYVLKLSKSLNMHYTDLSFHYLKNYLYPVFFSITGIFPKGSDAKFGC